VIGFAGVHLALRAEAAGVERAVEDGDLDTARRRGALLARVLTCHHHAEDTLLFPSLVERQPGVSTVTVDLEAQHAELDERLAALPRDLDGAPALRELVERHLAAEEQHVLPVWLASFTADERERFAGALRRATPIGEAGLMVSWLLDATPPEALGMAWAQVPAPIRMAHRVWFRRSYERRFGQLAVAA
jgi:hypothetical protein